MEVEYAKADAEDILIRVTVTNRGPEARALEVLPTLWFRNTWSWVERRATPVRGARRVREARPRLLAIDAAGDVAIIESSKSTSGGTLALRRGRDELLFTENEINAEKLFGVPSLTPPHVKDAFHDVRRPAATRTP